MEVSGLATKDGVMRRWFSGFGLIELLIVGALLAAVVVAIRVVLAT
jgi:hypothetical protein